MIAQFKEHSKQLKWNKMSMELNGEQTAPVLI